MKIAVITGAGSGIGRAAALMFAQRGMKVACVGRTRDTLEATLALITQAGGAGETIVADCGTTPGIAEVARRLAGQPVTALVHAAGHNLVKAFADITPADLEQLLNANLHGPFFLTQALLSNFSDGAAVVFIGSVAALRGRSRHAGYGTAKAALSGLTVNLAAELAPRIRVNCVSPGPTRTGMLRAYLAESTRGLSAAQLATSQANDAARILLGRVANPEEVARTIVHLALDATAVTGIDFPVDVGYTAS